MLMRYLMLLLLISGFVACEEEDTSPIGRYRTALESGHNAELTEPETVLGLSLGMTSQEYYDRCMQLNQAQLITAGGGGTQAEHMMANDLDRPARMSFRPVYEGKDPRIVGGIDTEFIYQDWAPWNKAAQAEVLITDVVDFFERTTTGEFIQLDHPQYGRIFVNISGGRILTVRKDGSSTVIASFSDLTRTDRDPLNLVR